MRAGMICIWVTGFSSLFMLLSFTQILKNRTSQLYAAIQDLFPLKIDTVTYFYFLKKLSISKSPISRNTSYCTSFQLANGFIWVLYQE